MKFKISVSDMESRLYILKKASHYLAFFVSGTEDFETLAYFTEKRETEREYNDAEKLSDNLSSEQARFTMLVNCLKFLLYHLTHDNALCKASCPYHLWNYFFKNLIS